MVMRALRWLGLVVLLVSVAVPVQAAEPIVVCGHAPITGLAPIARHSARFGEFYFDYVNAELGGIDGRPFVFRMYDDQNYPAGARAALEKCLDQTPHLLVGVSTVDPVVSASKWAEAREIPYLHSQASLEDTAGLGGQAHLSPSAEDSALALADLIVVNPSLSPSQPLRVGTLRINSPYYDAAEKALVAELDARGVTVVARKVVQHDDNQFSDVYAELSWQDVNVVAADLTPELLIRFMNQRPTGYEAALVSSSDWVGTTRVASAAASTGWSRFAVLHDASPAYAPEDPSVPWHDEEDTFKRIFNRYSPEITPPIDDLDWTFYVRAKQVHRFLEALNGDYSPAHIRRAFESYRESSEDSFPGCPLDFTVSSAHVGQHAWHTFRLSGHDWRQVGTCSTASTPADFSPPAVSCPPIVVGTLATCTATDPGAGVGAWEARDGSILSPEGIHGDGGCSTEATMEIPVPLGIHRFRVTATDCAGATSDGDVTLIAVGGPS